MIFKKRYKDIMTEIESLRLQVQRNVDQMIPRIGKYIEQMLVDVGKKIGETNFTLGKVREELEHINEKLAGLGDWGNQFSDTLDGFVTEIVTIRETMGDVFALVNATDDDKEYIVGVLGKLKKKVEDYIGLSLDVDKKALEDRELIFKTLCKLIDIAESFGKDDEKVDSILEKILGRFNELTEKPE